MFGDKLHLSIKNKNSFLCLGIDPNYDLIKNIFKEKIKSQEVKYKLEVVEKICKKIILICKDIVPIIKIQSAFFEEFGYKGIKLFEELTKFAKQNKLLTIADVKRGDINSTMKAYYKAFFEYNKYIDAITVNPYFADDIFMPYLKYKNKKGIFVLTKTSNKSAKKIQLNKVVNNILKLINFYSRDNIFKNNSNYSNIGAVVGLTNKLEEIKKIRLSLKKSFLLVPGLGAQQGDIKNIKYFFNKDNSGVIFNVSRDILFIKGLKNKKSYFDEVFYKALYYKELINKNM